MNPMWAPQVSPGGRSHQHRTVARPRRGSRLLITVSGILLSGLPATAIGAVHPNVISSATPSLHADSAPDDQTGQAAPALSAPVPTAVWTGGAGLAGLFVWIRLKRRWFV